MYEKDEERRRRELEALKAKEARLREELAAINKEARSARSKLLSTTKHENWHVRRLAALDMLMGYDGEMASARIYVRGLPFEDYVAALRPHAVAMPAADNLSIEIAAVRANHDEWHLLGEEIVLERERKAAEVERANWEEWRAKNPGTNDWRGKPMTRRQYFLISRTVDHLGIRMPAAMTRGAACDWIDEHGGNLRLARDGAAAPGGLSDHHFDEDQGDLDIDTGAGVVPNDEAPRSVDDRCNANDDRDNAEGDAS